MTCRLLLLNGEHGSVIDYWTASVEACREMADLWRFGFFRVWMEVFS